jgi:hypothetical protein
MAGIPKPKNDTNKPIDTDQMSILIADKIQSLKELNANTNYNIILPIILIIILIIVMLTVIFDVKTSSKTREKIAQESTIIVFFSLLIFVLIWLYLPKMTEFNKLFAQINNVVYIIIYTIFFILFYTLMSTDLLTTYSWIINSIMVGLGALAFYKGSVDIYATEFVVKYKTIKMTIVLFCFITLLITFYHVDPGGFATKYFGYSLLLTIIITVFGFLYLMINTVLTLDATNKSSIMTPLVKYGSISFIIFLISMALFITYNKNVYQKAFYKNASKGISLTIIMLIICILWVVLLGCQLYNADSNSNSALDASSLPDLSKISTYKKSLNILFGIVISGLIIFWISDNIEGLSGNSSIYRFILNLLMVSVILGIFYRTIYVKQPSYNSKTANFFNLIVKIVLYIPCLFSDLFDWVGNEINGSKETGSWIMLVFAVGLIVAYFKTPNVVNLISNQGGKQLINEPVYLNIVNNLGNYIDLNDGSDTFDYQYAISCWVSLDAVSPSISTSSNKFTSLLNFGNKPNILYESSTNTLMITMQQKDLQNVTKNKLTEFDENGNRIIYTNDHMLLQKWNNIIINYVGGTLDIFLNGELVKSTEDVIPYYTIDNLTIGETDGVKGGICNVIYFRKALKAQNIYYIYNTLKEETPPVINKLTKTII